MKALFTIRGEKKLIEVHEPLMDSYSIKVKLHYSAISFGTENANRQGTKLTSILKNKNLWKKGIELFKQNKNLLFLLRKLQDVRNTYNPIGYSGVGEILEVGRQVKYPLKVGDIVHVGGERACHSEIVVCPQNFVFKIEEEQYQKHPFLYSLPTIISVPMHAFWHARDVLNSKPPFKALIVGGGLIGTFAGLIAKRYNMEACYSDCSKDALASFFLQPVQEKERFDLLFFCVTSPKGLSEFIRFCREGAILSIVGEIPLHLDRALLEDKYMTVRFCKSFGYGRGNKAYEYGLEEPDNLFPHTMRENIRKSIEFLDLYKDKIMARPDIMHLIEPQFVSHDENPKKINIIQWINTRS